MLAVLWLAAGLSAIALTIANTVRGETERSSTEADGLKAYYLAAGAIDTATSKCTSEACLSKSYSAFYTQAHTLDGALQALWTAAGKSGPCAAATANAGAGFDSLTGSYHSLEAATLKNDKPAATKAYGQIQTKTPRLTAIISSFKTKCR